MASDPLAQAALALHRFGMGPHARGLKSIAGDPRGALLAELDAPGAGRVPASDLLTSAQAFRAVAEFNAERQARAKERAKTLASQQTGNAMAGEASSANNPRAEEGERAVPVPQQILRKEAQARLNAATSAETGFVERLVWFWSNHFCVSATKMPSMAGAFEREAIRPHVLGRFGDLLLAAESHPAMLFYLDNAQSIGPNSVAGVNRTRGIDENLAREILELHTLGVDGGYTQEDVTRFAYALTGWTFAPATGDPERGGEFIFVPRLHEPGAQTILGRSYAQPGMEQARAVLADLAAHEATARNLARKFAKHFVADAPPPSLVEKLSRNFMETRGDLREFARTLVNSPEAWSETRGKMKSPAEWIVSSLRLLRARPPIERVMRAQAQLGQPLWSPPSPKGFADEATAWIDGVGERLNLAAVYAQGPAAARLDARELVEVALGPLASRDTRETVGRAESRQQAVTLLLMSPEFLRR